jgi:hypothetical protein
MDADLRLRLREPVYINPTSLYRFEELVKCFVDKGVPSFVCEQVLAFADKTIRAGLKSPPRHHYQSDQREVRKQLWIGNQRGLWTVHPGTCVDGLFRPANFATDVNSSQSLAQLEKSWNR